MLNLGYACINNELAARGYSVNSSCIAKTFREKGKQHAIELAKSNLEAVIHILEYNVRRDIYLYRMSSDMFPQLTNPEFINKNSYAYNLEVFNDYFQRIGELATKYNQRLTFHPDHFNQIGTLHQLVLDKTITDLSMHADVLDLIGCDKNSVMVIHGGGTYKDKEKTMERWVENYIQLPEFIRHRLALENCETCYSIEDTIYMSNEAKKRTGRSIPLIFDTHHHDCYGLNRPYEDFLDDILATWDDKDMIPKFHISEQDPKKRLGAHSQYVNTIHDFFFNLTGVSHPHEEYDSDLSSKRRIDLMVEAKAKEYAVAKLKRKYGL